MSHNQQFLAGVIEGFYGEPWSQAERHHLFEWIARWGLNTYLYAPKDDLKHRAAWRELYSEAEQNCLRDLIQTCQKHAIRFIYALSPGLDLRYSEASDLEKLKGRFTQLLNLGCEHFCLLFDDIPDRLEPKEIARHGSLARAQASVANIMFEWVRQQRPEARFLFCPTPYCGRMANRSYGGENYLRILGESLCPDIDVFWTGPEIISTEISVSSIRELSKVLRRKPLIWDNLHANDYDGRRFFCGPYSGRPPELRGEVSGLLVNPNVEFPLNFVPLRTMAEFVNAKSGWEPRRAYLAGMREWLPFFSTVSGAVSFEDLVLFGDCYYLPLEEGPEAEALYACTRDLLRTDPLQWGGQTENLCQVLSRLKLFCVRLAELRNRPLFYALSRRIWELREELDLLEQYVRFRSEPRNAGKPFISDFHLRGTYRGGMVARLQLLLTQHPDSSLDPAMRRS